ncbi:MAG: mercuric transporter MerT family protein [Gammaproteobacteria bacterium]
MDTQPTLWASALAAVGASLCCVAPLVLVSLGVGGAWLAMLTRLEPLRPLFIVVTLGLLAFAWHRLYRRAAVCVPGQACADTAVLRRQRLIFWLVAVLLLLLLAFPWYAFLFY